MAVKNSLRVPAPPKVQDNGQKALPRTALPNDETPEEGIPFELQQRFGAERKTPLERARLPVPPTGPSQEATEEGEPTAVGITPRGPSPEAVLQRRETQQRVSEEVIEPRGAEIRLQEAFADTTPAFGGLTQGDLTRFVDQANNGILTPQGITGLFNSVQQETAKLLDPNQNPLLAVDPATGELLNPLGPDLTMMQIQSMQGFVDFVIDTQQGFVPPDADIDFAAITEQLGIDIDPEVLEGLNQLDPTISGPIINQLLNPPEEEPDLSGLFDQLLPGMDTSLLAGLDFNQSINIIMLLLASRGGPGTLGRPQQRTI